MEKRRKCQANSEKGNGKSEKIGGQKKQVKIPLRGRFRNKVLRNPWVLILLKSRFITFQEIITKRNKEK